MKRNVLAIIFFLFCFNGFSQELTWTPNFPTESTSGLVITLDATKGNQALLNYSGAVYVHIGVITNLSKNPGDWQHVLTTWGSADANYQATSLGNNKWSFTLTGAMGTYFQVNNPGEHIQKIALLFRNADASLKQTNADGSDMYIPVYSTATSVRITVPPFQPTYFPTPEPITQGLNSTLPITAVASNASTMKIYFNGNPIQTAAGATTISASPVITTTGNQIVVAEADDGSGGVDRDTLSFYVPGSVNVSDLPSGVHDGINYINSTTVTLVLYAPGKGRVAVIGDFPGNNWMEQSSFQMNKTTDGNRWWITISGLTSGTEYSYQYLVDGTLRIADPYTEKVLDPDNDQYITSATYPNLKPYPYGYTSQIVGTLQTNQTPYLWKAQNFTRPDKRNLIIYELLVRDFVFNHDWNSLSDTLWYLKNLGINAIELMPFNEFDGNSSWGYNPDFYFAPDKYYGPENTLKAFIDKCHQMGIAVIMDIALNHSTGNSPLVRLYFDQANNRPAPNNPWYNPVATHPFSVYNDMNHESTATHYFVGRILNHWMQDYKIDGFRFDLSKGFTQKQTTDVGVWSQYDQSRINILEGYYDSIQNHNSGAYLILEHFADNSEETVLSNYGMLLWGNMNTNYTQASMGYVGSGDNSDFSYGIANVRGWSNPYLVTYMESHDEERMMYKNLNFGNSSAGTPPYNIKVLDTALQRQQEAAAFLFTIPGPKMFWQFGEVGYDYSINYCPSDGTVKTDGSCRTDPKPIRWDYYQNSSRRDVYNTFKHLIQLRSEPTLVPLFTSNTTSQNFSGPTKWLVLSSPGSKLVAIGNFGVSPAIGQVTFPSAGTWYDFLNGTTFAATGSQQALLLKAGEFHVYLNVQIALPVTLVSFDAIRRNGQNVLTWKVAAEVNTARYEIMRSTDGVNFETIGQVLATGGETYSYTDDELVSAPVVYYKLRMVDIDGKIGYSDVRIIKQNADDFSVKVMTNPFRDVLKLNIQSSVSDKAFITITDVQGRQLLSDRENVIAGQNELQINQTSKLSSGIYFVNVRLNEKTAVQKVIKF